MRQLAVVREYAELIDALRARRDELDVGHETIDQVSGLQNGYTSKLLSNPPKKHLGLGSLGPILGALGVALVLVEDTAQLEKIRTRLIRRRFTGRYAALVATEIHAAARILNVGVIHTTEKAREMARKRWDSTPPNQRKSMARKAVKARWKKVWSKPTIREVAGR